MAMVTWLEFGYPVNDRVEARRGAYVTAPAHEYCGDYPEDQEVPAVDAEYRLDYTPTLGWVLECTSGECRAQFWPEAEVS